MKYVTYKYVRLYVTDGRMTLPERIVKIRSGIFFTLFS